MKPHDERLNEIFSKPDLRHEVAELLNALDVAYEDLRACKKEIESLQAQRESLESQLQHYRGYQ